ncbi:hypothetical protein C8R47DRAFT_1070446 [Mycena vitilis]|nr:hypothetical protein C8R47DRAFT_1070446 [Mycena vitilis]
MVQRFGGGSEPGWLYNGAWSMGASIVIVLNGIFDLYEACLLHDTPQALGLQSVARGQQNATARKRVTRSITSPIALKERQNNKAQVIDVGGGVPNPSPERGGDLGTVRYWERMGPPHSTEMGKVGGMVVVREQEALAKAVRLTNLLSGIHTSIEPPAKIFQNNAGGHVQPTNNRDFENHVTVTHASRFRLLASYSLSSNLNATGARSLNFRQEGVEKARKRPFELHFTELGSIGVYSGQERHVVYPMRQKQSLPNFGIQSNFGFGSESLRSLVSGTSFSIAAENKSIRFAPVFERCPQMQFSCRTTPSTSLFLASAHAKTAAALGFIAIGLRGGPSQVPAPEIRQHLHGAEEREELLAGKGNEEALSARVHFSILDIVVDASRRIGAVRSDVRPATTYSKRSRLGPPNHYFASAVPAIEANHRPGTENAYVSSTAESLPARRKGRDSSAGSLEEIPPPRISGGGEMRGVAQQDLREETETSAPQTPCGGSANSCRPVPRSFEDILDELGEEEGTDECRPRAREEGSKARLASVESSEQGTIPDTPRPQWQIWTGLDILWTSGARGEQTTPDQASSFRSAGAKMQNSPARRMNEGRRATLEAVPPWTDASLSLKNAMWRTKAPRRKIYVPQPPMAMLTTSAKEGTQDAPGVFCCVRRVSSETYLLEENKRSQGGAHTAVHQMPDKGWPHLVVDSEDWPPLIRLPGNGLEEQGRATEGNGRHDVRRTS